MKYINQKMYVEKYEINQVPIDENLVDYIQDELLSDSDIDINLIDEALIEYFYDKNTKSQLNLEQLLMVESGEIAIYKEAITEIIDEYILNNGIDISWSGVKNSDVIEEWISKG